MQGVGQQEMSAAHHAGKVGYVCVGLGVKSRQEHKQGVSQHKAVSWHLQV
jgi:hypothetical protein